MYEPLPIPIVKLSPTRRNVIMRGRAWSQVVPIAALPAQRAFYTKLAKKGPKQAEVYTPWVAALDAVIEEVKNGRQ